MPVAAYDEIANWYEDWVHETSQGDPIGVGHALAELLGDGQGTCLEVACGTGFHAGRIRRMGWTPVGVDLSANMLSHARNRLPAAQADATRLPIVDSSLPAVVSVMSHTDLPAYEPVLREVARVLRPGGVFVHVGVHPCFCGGFADRSDPTAVVISPGYLDGHWTTKSWTDKGVRNRVGATPRPPPLPSSLLPELLGAFLTAGLTFGRFLEGGAPTPTVFAVRATA